MENLSVSKQSSLSPIQVGVGLGMGMTHTAMPSHGSPSKRETTTPTNKTPTERVGADQQRTGGFRQESWGRQVSERHPHLRAGKQTEPQAQPELPGTGL